ncbi:MAG TPA: zf-HC2 domain-containing protein [Euzebyales bacterium]|nr:zf-HC2 domain-containing protein [Euzebyales bacterium]
MSDLDCNEFVELVTAFLEDGLDTETEQRVIDHLALCAGCEQYFAQFQQTIRALGDLGPQRLPDDTRAALLEAFRNDRA